MNEIKHETITVTNKGTDRERKTFPCAQWQRERSIAGNRIPVV
jgi:hypothetical protein